MKKTILFLLGLFFVSVQTFADTRATALLLHNGQGKSFDADQLQQAVNEAVAGDTIYLSEGTFQPGTMDTLFIDKAVSLIGAGGDVTKVIRYILISIDGNPQLDNFQISGIHTNSILVSKQMRGLSISKCFLDGYFTATDSVLGVKIDRCYMHSLIPTKYVRSVSAYNSCFNRIGGIVKNPYYFNSSGCDLMFMNCLIYDIDANYIDDSSNRGGRVNDATFMNCIIGNISNWNSSQEYNTYINCLIRTSPKSGNVVTNCYVDNKLQINTDGGNSDFPSCKLNNQELTNAMLIENGYIGTDGYVVGAYGGSTPYSLKPDGISVKESVLRVDPETRKLNVTLKVATE